MQHFDFAPQASVRDAFLCLLSCKSMDFQGIGRSTEEFLLKYSDDHILFFTTAFLSFLQLEFRYMQTSVAPLYFGLLHFESFMSFKAESVTPNVWFKTSVPLNLI